jgi:hypothetical protein
MAELFIFTIFATIIAVYNVLPRYRQLRIGYSLYKRGILAIIGVFVLLTVATYVASLYLQHKELETLGSLNTVDFTPLSIDLIQLGSAIVILLIFISTISKSNVHVRNESFLLSNLRDLYNRSEYSTLVEVIDDNYKPLIDHPAKPREPPSQRDVIFAQEWAEELTNPENIESDAEESSSEVRQQFREHIPDEWCDRLRDTYTRVLEQLVYRWELIRYYTQETAEEASDYTETLLLDPAFRQEHPLIDPYLGIDIISDEDTNFPREEFTHGYLSSMLRAENSLLYRNIAENRNFEEVYRYRIDPDNHLLHTLFSDCEVAKTLNVYKPIGDTTEDILREQGGKDYDQYNGRQFSDSEYTGTHVFSDPLFVAIRFFDIMVREAFSQEMEWHMWLYYYESFTRLICDNYKLTEEADRTAEWPNDYSRLLYEMVRSMRDWLNLLEKMVLEDDGELTETSNSGDEDYKEFIRLDNIDADRASGNLPKAAVICLMSCHKSIVLADEIPMQFKEYITEQIFTTGVELSQHEDDSLPDQYSQLILANLRENIEDRRTGAEYQSELSIVYNGDVQREVRVQALTGGGISDELDEIILGYS